MRVSIDQEKCIGAGLCVIGAEDIFDQREEDGIVILLDPSPPADREEAAREAAVACPVLAIEVS